MKQFLLLVLFSLLVPASIYAQEILFFDDFENGMDDAWVMPGGGWVVDDGHLLNSSFGAYLYAGGNQQSDYIVSYDFQITSGAPSHMSYWFGCFFLMSEPVLPWQGNTDGYFVKFGRGDIWTVSSLMIFRYDNSVESLVGSFSGFNFWDPIGVDNILN